MKSLSIQPNASNIVYTGRWHVTPESASATACGSSFRLGFRGSMAMLCFDTTHCRPPVPHLYLCVDGGARCECAVDRYLCVRTDTDGDHELTVLIKSASEQQPRWTNPAACVRFLGCIDTLASPLAPDSRPIIEFVGDSITEGISVSPQLAVYEGDRWEENLVFINDVCASYSYQTAALLNCRPVIMGYGQLGLTKGGGGGVPCVPDAYPFAFDRFPYPGQADLVVINHGTNDLYSPDAAGFQPAYRRLLDAVRKQNPQADIWAVAPFCGAFRAEIAEVVADYNRQNGTRITFVDTAGWLPPEPLHPSESGHRLAARRLAAIIRQTTTKPLSPS